MNKEQIKALLLRIFRLEVEWSYADEEKNWRYREMIDQQLDRLRLSLDRQGITMEDDPIEPGLPVRTVILLNGNPWLKFDLNQLDQSNMDWEEVEKGENS